VFVLRADGKLKFETLPNCYAGGGGHRAPTYLIVSKTIKRRRKFTEHKMLFLSLLQLFPTYFCCDTYLKSYNEDARRNKKLSVSTEIDFNDST
jgi:hypothetical protein